MSPRIQLYLFLIFSLVNIGANAQDIDFQSVGPVKAAFISEVSSIQPGIPFEAGLYLVPDDHWHLYWKNPGDAGLPPTFQWDIPEHVSISDIHFSTPSIIRTDPLAAYGYPEAVLYPVTITPPDNIADGDSIIFSVKADWLVCKEVCLPGEADFRFSLPVNSSATEVDNKTKFIFEKHRALLPEPFPENWKIKASLTAEKIYLEIRPDDVLSQAAEIQFFAAQKAVINHAAAQLLTVEQDRYQLEIIRSAYSLSDPEQLSGILSISMDNLVRNYEFDIPLEKNNSILTTTGSENQISLWMALLFAFLGGLLLNLMPCVLPVLSLKVLGMVEQANQGRRSALVHGLFFTLGVLVTFWVIVSVMLFLQAGGEQIGWGFQLQSPVFVLFLSAFMFLFALNLFGLFEINFLVGFSQKIKGKKQSGLTAAFISGITATLVATPCTAPFMGAALGYTLTQSPYIALLTYTFVGLGMALPYMLMAAFPYLLKFVPKPGRWMESFKQAMGFLLAATVIWLGWILSSLAGPASLIVMLCVLFFISIAGWIYGRWGAVSSPVRTRWFSHLLAIVLIMSSLFMGQKTIASFGYNATALNPSDRSGIQWINYSNEKLEQLLADKKNVFIDFTAAWCLSCKVNEQVAFSSMEVQQEFEKLNIIPLKADWTQRSNEITQALAVFGRNSVPLYVIYKKGDRFNPIILPEIITPGIVLEYLQTLE